MRPWSRWKSPHDQILDASAEVDIFAPPPEVWNLIRPAENAILLEPSTIRAFHVPGTPFGAGEMQGFIIREEGRERIAMIEVLEELPERYALTRPVGIDDDAMRVAYILRESGSGTRLELRVTFTVPSAMWEQADGLVEETRHRNHQLAQRIKWLVEEKVYRPGSRDE